VTGERLRAPTPVEAWADSAAARGREIWPALVVSAAELVDLVELRRTLPGVRRAELDELDPAELYLAAACARGDCAAVGELRRRYFEGVIPQLRRMGLGSAQCDDIWQTMCERVLVATDGPPAIVRYVGTGELAGLMRIAATRLALNWLKQDQRRVAEDEWLDDLPAARADPELQLSKQQHRAEIKQAIEEALETLVARDRMILRLHLVERLGIDAIARISSVHRTTAARWIARAKETLGLRVRDRLLARWRITESSFPALRTLIDSQIDLSLERLLASE
jgi:RNA polymerase sigma-70 factor, ECF subfamily